MRNIVDKKRDNLIIEKFNYFKKKIIKYINQNPRNIFLTMICLTILSIAGNVFYYYFGVKNAKNSYDKMSNKIFKADEIVADKKQDISIMQQAENYLEMKNDLNKLKEYEKKSPLEKSDSLEIIRITKKYNLN